MIAQAGRSLIILLAVTLSLVTVAGAQPLRFFGGIGDVDALTFTDDQKLLLATGYLVVEYDLETHAITKIHHPWQERVLHGMWDVPGGTGVVMLDSQVRPKRWERAEGTVVTGLQLNPPVGSEPPYTYLGWTPLVECSPDGALLAILIDATKPVELSELRIFDAETLELLDVKTPPGRFIKVRPAFSDDGRTVYTGITDQVRGDGEDNPTLMEWDLPGDVVETYENLFPSGFLFNIIDGTDGLRFYWGRHLSDETRVAVCTRISLGRARIVFWETAMRLPSQREAIPLSGVYNWLMCGSGYDPFSIGYAGDARAVISGRGRYLVRQRTLLEVDTGAVVRENLSAQQFSRDETLLAQGHYYYGDLVAEYVVRISDGETVDGISALPNGGIRRIAALHKPMRLICLEKGVLTTYDVRSGQPDEPIRLAPPYPAGIVVSPGESLIAYRDNANVFVGSADDLTTRGLLLEKTANVDLAFNPANNRLLVVGNSLKEYRINPDDFAASPVVRTYDPQATGEFVYTCAAYSPDGSVLLAARGGGVPELQRYDAFDGSLLSTSKLGRQWDDIEFDPSGALLLVSEGGTRSLYRSDTLYQERSFTGPIHAAAFAMGGKLILTAGDNALSIWSASRGFVGSTPVTSDLPVHSIVPSPIEDIVYIADGERVLEWRLPLRAALEHPEELQLDVILKREHTITPVRGNGDGIYDAADVLLEARRAGP